MVSSIHVSILILSNILIIFIIIIIFLYIHNHNLFNYSSYYDIPVNEVRKLINAVDNKKTEFSHPIFISKRLRKLLEISEPIEELKELKQQIIDLQSSIKNLKDKTSDNNKTS
jgi:hypothetical protein